MSKKFYEPVEMRKDTLAIVQLANQLLTSYNRMGYQVTLRQLYYQYIAKDLFPVAWIDRKYNQEHGLDPLTKNTQKNYKRLGSIIDNARKCGLIDWDHMVDLGRECNENPHYDTMADFVESCSRWFRYQTWHNQPWHVEVMVEKQALEGVLLPVCRDLDIPFSANKGYSSSSSMREAGIRLRHMLDAGKNIAVIYLGDHDPSGLDMSRDVKDRLRLYSGYEFWAPKDAEGTAGYKKAMETKNPRYFEKYRNAAFNDQEFVIERAAMNMDQIEQFNCPPNPAKNTDSRFAAYAAEYGDESWELDAIPVQELDRIVREAVAKYRDDDIYEVQEARRDWGRKRISELGPYLPYDPDGDEFNEDEFPLEGNYQPDERGPVDVD